MKTVRELRKSKVYYDEVDMDEYVAQVEAYGHAADLCGSGQIIPPYIEVCAVLVDGEDVTDAMTKEELEFIAEDLNWQWSN